MVLRQQAQVAGAVELHGPHAVRAVRQTDLLGEKPRAGVGGGAPAQFAVVDGAVLVGIDKQDHASARVGVAAQGGGAGVAQSANRRIGARVAAGQGHVVEVGVGTGARVLGGAQYDAHALGGIVCRCGVVHREGFPLAIGGQFGLGDRALGQDGTVQALQ